MHATVSLRTGSARCMFEKWSKIYINMQAIEAVQIDIKVSLKYSFVDELDQRYLYTLKILNDTENVINEIIIEYEKLLM